MGTKIQCKMYAPGYYSLREPNHSIGSTSWLLNHNNRISKDGKYDVYMTETFKDRFMGCDKEQLRQTILNHESIFRHQLNELHRLYQVQRKLTNEMKRNEMQKHSVPVGSAQIMLYSSSVPSDDEKMRFCTSSFPLGSSIYCTSSPAGPTRIQTPPKLMNGVLIKSKCHPSEYDACPTNFQSSDSKGKMLQRQLFDLGLPADEYINSEKQNLGLSGASRVEDQPSTRTKEISQKRNVDLSVGGTVNGRSTEYSFCKQSGPENFQISFKSRQSGTTADNVANALVQFEERKTGQQRIRKLFGVEIPEPSDVHVNGKSLTATTSRAETDLSKGLDLACQGRQVSGPSMDFVYSNGMSNSILASVEQRNAKKNCGGFDFMNNVKTSYFTTHSIVSSNEFQVGLGFQQNHVSVHGQRKQDCSGEDQESQHCDGDSLKEKEGLDALKNANTNAAGKGSSKCSKGPWVAGHASNSEHGRKDCNIMRHQIDLNLSLAEETITYTSPEKAESGPGLEPPGKLKNEIVMEKGNYPGTKLEKQSKSLHDKAGGFSKELITMAAEALVAMSLSQLDSQVDCTVPQLYSTPDNPLSWFTDIVCSRNNEHQNKFGVISVDKNGSCNEDQVPEGLDYFEHMTLKLTETVVGECHSDSVPLQDLKDEKPMTNQPHRGQAKKKGRHRKDFQRDVLPGLSCLSKYEVTEDLHAFEGLVRAASGSWQSAMAQRSVTKNSSGRGRKRSAGAAPAITKNSNSQQLLPPPPGTELALRQGSLTGWGKRIRRLPRQRGSVKSESLSSL